jgi:formate hydrogenlyase subunit 6/NADH:ubiquinone oxidoreductase subunit I
MLKTTLKSLFMRPVTVDYPKKPKQNADTVRGSINIDIETCIFCGICTKKCPSNCITVDRPNKTWTINRFDCVVCGYCAENCPKKCLIMSNQITQPDFAKKQETHTQPLKNTQEKQA